MISRSQIVFACYSKSCAPPPAGKGGSSAGGSSGGFTAADGVAKLKSGNIAHFKHKGQSVIATVTKSPGGYKTEVRVGNRQDARPGSGALGRHQMQKLVVKGVSKTRPEAVRKVAEYFG